MRLLLATITLVIGCDGGTPVRFEICDAAGQNCFVHARFKDYESCKKHDAFMSANCDHRTPGRIVCDTTQKSTFSTSKCSE